MLVLFLQYGLTIKVAPPRRLELRSSAPEADTLSTELRGREEKFYHIAYRHCEPDGRSNLHPRVGDCFALRARNDDKLMPLPTAQVS